MKLISSTQRLLAIVNSLRIQPFTMSATNGSKSLAFHSTHNDRYERMTGGAPTRIGERLLRDISPKITSSSHILDNACGPGVLSVLIKAEHEDVKITGADLTQGMLDQYKAKAERFGWRNTTTELLDMRYLTTLIDNTFTHSFTSLGLQALSSDPEGPLKACKELYRVTKPGGVAAVSMWSERTFPEAFKATARRVRPSEEPLEGMKDPERWTRGSWLMEILEDAGFGANVSVRPCPTYNEQESLDELVNNLWTFSSFFFNDYSDTELEKAKAILKEEVLAMPGFVTDEKTGNVRMPMVALMGFAWKTEARKLE